MAAEIEDSASRQTQLRIAISIDRRDICSVYLTLRWHLGKLIVFLRPYHNAPPGSQTQREEGSFVVSMEPPIRSLHACNYE